VFILKGGRGFHKNYEERVGQKTTELRKILQILANRRKFSSWIKGRRLKSTKGWDGSYQKGRKANARRIHAKTRLVKDRQKDEKGKRICIPKKQEGGRVLACKGARRNFHQWSEEGKRRKPSWPW